MNCLSTVLKTSLLSNIVERTKAVFKRPSVPKGSYELKRVKSRAKKFP